MGGVFCFVVFLALRGLELGSLGFVLSFFSFFFFEKERSGFDLFWEGVEERECCSTRKEGCFDGFLG